MGKGGGGTFFILPCRGIIYLTKENKILDCSGQAGAFVSPAMLRAGASVLADRAELDGGFLSEAIAADVYRQMVSAREQELAEKHKFGSEAA
jgi:hypothetical protein